MIINRIIILILLVFSSKIQAGNMIDSLYTKHELLADKITKEVGEELSDRYGIVFCGTGGSINNDVKIMALSFDCYKKLNLEDARELVVNCSLEYLESINSNSELRPYLHKFPFQPSNIELRIFIYDPNKRGVDVGDLVVASVLNGKLIFRKLAADDSYEKVLEESFEEAVRKVRGE